MSAGTGSFFDYPTDEGKAEEDPLVLLADLADEDWAVIRDHADVRRYRAGEVVVAAGQGDRDLYIVVRGTLVTEVPRRWGRPRPGAVLGAGSVLGELAFFGGRPRSALVRASTESELLRLGFESFEVLAAKHGDLARRILFDLGRILALRLLDLEQRLLHR